MSQSPNVLCPPGSAGHAGPSRVSRSAKFVSLSLLSSGTGRSPRQELQWSYLRAMRELRSDGRPASSFPGGGRGGGGGSGPTGLEELKGRNSGRQRLISCGGSRDSGVQESGEAASALVCLRRCACAPEGARVYVFASVRARVFAFDCPAPAGGTGLGGGQATPRTGFPPSSLLLSFFLLFLPPSCSLRGTPPPAWSPASW